MSGCCRSYTNWMFQSSPARCWEQPTYRPDARQSEEVSILSCRCWEQRQPVRPYPHGRGFNPLLLRVLGATRVGFHVPEEGLFQSSPSLGAGSNDKTLANALMVYMFNLSQPRCWEQPKKAQKNLQTFDVSILSCLGAGATRPSPWTVRCL